MTALCSGNVISRASSVNPSIPFSDSGDKVPRGVGVGVGVVVGVGAWWGLGRASCGGGEVEARG